MLASWLMYIPTILMSSPVLSAAAISVSVSNRTMSTEPPIIAWIGLSVTEPLYESIPYSFR